MRRRRRIKADRRENGVQHEERHHHIPSAQHECRPLVRAPAPPPRPVRPRLRHLRSLTPASLSLIPAHSSPCPAPESPAPVLRSTLLLTRSLCPANSNRMHQQRTPCELRGLEQGEHQCGWWLAARCGAPAAHFPTLACSFLLSCATTCQCGACNWAWALASRWSPCEGSP